MMNICRLCLYKGDEKQILSVWNCHIEDLSNKIRSCVSVNIKKNDELPTTACLSCIHQVIQWVTFKETCEKSNSILLNNFTQNKQKNDFPRIFDKQSRPSSNRTIKIEDNIRWNDTEDSSSSFEDKFHDLHIEYNVTEHNYICDICKKGFENCIDYLDHQLHHNGNPVFKCDKCTEVFDSREKLVNHDKNHRRPCVQCGKMVLQSSMKLHLIMHTDRHRCIHCLNRFSSKATLSQHIIMVHTDIKNHVCDTCGKRFSSQTAMRVHMRSHSDERLYKCKECSYAGRTAAALYVHMSTHATDLCVCEFCSKTFKSTRNLNDHLRRVHSKIKRYECSYCKKKFVDRYMLSIHIRCHTGVRPYKCTICGKTFIRSDGLKEHIATHGERTFYDCRNCGKKFTSKRGIVRHNCTAVT